MIAAALFLLLAAAAGSEPVAWKVLFFVTNDCPISNAFAPEIRRICTDPAYRDRGVACTVVYVDPGLSDAEAQKHAQEYGHTAYPIVVDRKHELVRATGATITPEVAVIRAKGGGPVAYLGRIDDSFLRLGQSRRTAGVQHDLRDALDQLLAGRPVARPRTKAVGCFIPDLAVLTNERKK